MFISEQEGYINYEPVCDYIAKMSNGQMRDDIKMALKTDEIGLVNRMGGNLISVDDIMPKIREIVGGTN